MNADPQTRTEDKATLEANGTKQALPFMPQQYALQAFLHWQQIMSRYVLELSRTQMLDAGGKTFESAMLLKQRADQALEVTVSSMQLPTRSDIELLFKKLNNLEVLLRDLSDKADLLLEREQEL